MAIDTICGAIRNGQDNSCKSVNSRFYQQAVIINLSDLDSREINADNVGETCSRNVQFSLKDGKTGYRFTLSENGSAISGTYDVSRNDFGYSTFLHRVNLALTDATEEDKCTIEGLVKGRFVVALQRGEIIEIYGIENGLSAGDFTADTQANSGFIAITLESLEGALESHVPLVYKASSAGQEIEDFDSNFAQTI